jgi:hypothetical protein
MHSSTTLRGWRKAGVVAGSLAVLATGGAAMTAQAFAAPGSGTHRPAGPQGQDTRTKGLESTGQARGSDAASDLASTGRAHTAALHGAVTELVPGQGAQTRLRRYAIYLAAKS